MSLDIVKKNLTKYEQVRTNSRNGGRVVPH